DPNLIPAVTGRFQGKHQQSVTIRGGNPESEGDSSPFPSRFQLHGTGVVIIVLGDVEGLGEAFSQLVGFQVNPAEEIGHFRCGVNSLKLRELVGDPPVGGRLSVAQGGEAEAGKVYAAGIEGTLFIDDALDVPDHLFRIRGKDIPVKAVGGVAVQQVGQLG